MNVESRQAGAERLSDLGPEARAEWLEAIFEGSRDAIFLTDEEGRFVAVNRAACALTGFGREELLARSVPDLHDEEDLGTYRTYHERILGGEEVLSRAAIRRKDGCKVEAEFSSRAVRVGGTLYVHTTARDVSDRRKAEEVERKASEAFRILTENVKDVAWVLDAKTLRYRYVSPAIVPLLGYPVEEVLRMPLGGPFPPDVGERLREGVKARAAAFVTGGEVPGVFFTDELEQPHRDGSFVWTEVVSGFYRNPESGRVELRGVTRDITERRRDGEEIRRLNESLEERVAERTAQLAAANRELESFSYSVSHDLRAPLRAIDGFSKRVADVAGPLLDDESRRMLGVVRQNALRMGRLIDGLLSFSRTGRAELQKSAVPMEALVRSVFAEVVQELPGKERFVLEAGALPAAWGDPVLLRQVWVNLLSNAVKFSAPSAAPRIEVTGEKQARGTVWTVRDNGVGFDMAYASKLFGVFQRLHGIKEFEGNGVGLALVQRIVTRHGGRIWAEGSPGNGATFRFFLPEEGTEGLGLSGSFPALRT